MDEEGSYRVQKNEEQCHKYLVEENITKIQDSKKIIFTTYPTALLYITIFNVLYGT